MVYRCSVRGCEEHKLTMHSFPNPTKYSDTFRRWLLACSNSELDGLDPEVIYKRKRVCQKHFEPSSLMNVKLVWGAIPTLSLPSASAVEERQIDSVVAEELSTNIAEGEQQMPSTLVLSDTEEVIEPRVITGCSSVDVRAEGIDVLPEPSRIATTPTKRKREQVLHEIGVTKSSDLIPKAKALYKRTMVLKDRVRKLRQKSMNLQNKFRLTGKNEELETILSPLYSHGEGKWK